MQEELRALRTAVQLMVKRTEERSASQPLLQPASSAMEPIQEGGSEADGSAGSPAEEAAPEPAPSKPASTRAPEPHMPTEVRLCMMPGVGPRATPCTIFVMWLRTPCTTMSQLQG